MKPNAALAFIVSLPLVLATSCKKDLKDVKYAVYCASCDLTYENQGGNTEQITMSGSWDYEFPAEEGTFVYLSAQNNNNSGTVSVQISVDGGVIEEASSSGAFVIATASGSVP